MLIRIGILALAATTLASSAVQRIEVKERTDVLQGRAMRDAGPYERITATVHFRVDPKLKQNRGITGLDLAPVDKDGFVEFSADLLVLKPRDPAKGNGTAVIDVPNRGNMLVVSTFNRGTPSPDPQAAAELGDLFLMEHGFTVVSIGWQWDVPDAKGRLGLKAPRLPESVAGLVRSEFVPDKTVKRFSLADRDHVPYPVADESDAANRLYVSDAPGHPRREIPRARWRFVDKTSVEVDGGCEPGKIYEVVYRSRSAVPVGLGFAAVRDMASFLKFGESPFLLGDQRRFIKRTIAFGVSQTGRFLRHMMYEGFNADEKDRKALDGVWADVAGAGRGGFNHRFAQPSRDGQTLLHYSWPVDLFPFADTPMNDPLTGRSGGLLKRVKEENVAPKIFYTNHSYEYWGRAASLIHTTPDGRSDVAPDENTRIYFLAGGQHGVGTLPLARTDTRNSENPLDLRWAMRALLISMHEWLKEGKEPPASVYPRIAKGELVPPSQAKYPAPIQAPRYPRIPHVLDFGSEFLSGKIVTKEPPAEGTAYTVLVPRLDQDGNEIGGVRMPEIDVPLGVFTGWNLRSAAIGNPDQMIAFRGSFFPFPASQLRQRYGSKEDYLTQIRKAALQLTDRGFALRSDVEKMVSRAGQLWDGVQAQP